MIPQNLALVGGTLLAPALARRMGTAGVLVVGLVVSGIGLGMLTMVEAEGGLPMLVCGLVVACGGVGLPMSQVTNLILSAAPPEKAGAAASISETSGEFGIAVGVAALGSLGAAVYRSAFIDIVPATLPAESAAGAAESLTAAITAAQDLPAPLATELLAAARDAFSTGLGVTAGTGAVIFGLLAVLDASLLRRHRVPTVPDKPEPITDARTTTSV